jgi:hypothetical protein
MASARHKQQHTFRLSYQLEVGSSIDPDMEDISRWERELQGLTPAAPSVANADRIQLQFHLKQTLAIFPRTSLKILTMRSWPSTLRSLPKASSARPSTNTLTSATGMESTMPPSLPPWGIARCGCSAKPLLGCIISRCTGYRAVHYFSIILTAIYSESTGRQIDPPAGEFHARTKGTVSPAFAAEALARIPCAAGVWTISEEAPEMDAIPPAWAECKT